VQDTTSAKDPAAHLAACHHAEDIEAGRITGRTLARPAAQAVAVDASS
jgi:hypothetical protein